MVRLFNTTGPCIPGEHYMLSPEARCPGVLELIDKKHFFVLHAPRQSGKTTLFQTFEKLCNASGRYHALYCSLETIQGITDPGKGIPAIIQRIAFAVEFHPGLSKTAPAPNADNPAMGLLRYFIDLTRTADRPVVLFLDEADCLSGETLILFLRQLRDGYVNRGSVPFIHSLALVGMRNIRDYKLQIRDETQTLGSASPFNIAKEALTLCNFTRPEIAALYQQHTDDTGQAFPTEVTDRVYELTQGQPWLVNALAAEMIEKLGKNDPRYPLTAETVEAATERLIMRRDTHIDSLLERLKEERVRRIIEPVLLGEGDSIDRLATDYQFVRDLGLVRNDQGVIRIANPIYNEVIARTLNYNVQQGLPPELIHRWMDREQIDLSGLLKAFQEFWRDHSEAWQQRLHYQEAAPHLILMGFLQRVVNGGARIDREFATGSRRVDLCVHYASRRYPIELKIVRSAQTREEGLRQLTRYMDGLGCREGWLVLFDLEGQKPWDQRLSWETVTREGRTIHLVGA